MGSPTQYDDQGNALPRINHCLRFIQKVENEGLSAGFAYLKSSGCWAPEKDVSEQATAFLESVPVPPPPRAAKFGLTRMRVRVPLNDRITIGLLLLFPWFWLLFYSILELDEPAVTRKKDARSNAQNPSKESFYFVVPLKIRCPVLGLILRVLFENIRMGRCRIQISLHQPSKTAHR